MSRRSRGLYWEASVEKYLQSLGFVTDRARASVKPLFLNVGRRIYVSSRNDIFGCLDVIAVHPKADYTLCIQATISAADAPKKKKDINSVPWNHRAQKVQIWTRDPGRRSGVRVFALGEYGWKDYRFKLEKGVPAPREILGELPLSSESRRLRCSISE